MKKWQNNENCFARAGLMVAKFDDEEYFISYS
jgi:hypothetical protein